MNAIVVYDDKKDKEHLDLINSNFPIYIHYINYNTVKGRKEAFKVKSHWSAIKNPFVVIEDDEGKTVKVFYSEKDNAINQLINYLNDSKN